MAREELSGCEITVALATGMVAEFATCSVDEALVLMRERAQVAGQSLYDIAALVVERRRWFGL